MLNKKIIWICGGSTGIGRATTIKFIEEGWVVVATARNKENLEIIILQLRKFRQQ